MLVSHSAPLPSDTLSNLRPDQISYQPPDVQNQPITLTLMGMVLEAAKACLEEAQALVQASGQQHLAVRVPLHAAHHRLAGLRLRTEALLQMRRQPLLTTWPATWEPTTSSLLTSLEMTT